MKDKLDISANKIADLYDELDDTLELVELECLINLKTNTKKIYDIRDRYIKETSEKIEEEGKKNNFNYILLIEKNKASIENYVERIISKTNTNISKLKIEGFKTTEELYNALAKRVKDPNYLKPSIVYKNGKKVNWKSYMEMSTRTAIHNEATQYQKDNKFFRFFYVQEFGDCADDHRPYQGKYYYNENASFTQEEKQFILNKKLKSIQVISENKPYLTTRPNCRHSFLPITGKEMMGGFSMPPKNGKVDKAKYDALQNQRKLERQIRAYKTKKNELEMLNQDTKSVNNRIKQKQKELRDLISNNQHLKRDYRRENPDIVKDDLGARYRNK